MTRGALILTVACLAVRSFRGNQGPKSSDAFQVVAVPLIVLSGLEIIRTGTCLGLFSPGRYGEFERIEAG